MEEDERGLRSEEEALIEDLEKEKGKRKAAVEEKGLEMECLGREMAEEVKSWRDCVIVKGNGGIWRKGMEEFRKRRSVINAGRETEMPKKRTASELSPEDRRPKTA